MIKWILLVLLFLSLVSCTRTHTPMQIEGRWVNADYLTELQNYKSPKNAETITDIFYFDIMGDTICITYDLHTGNGINILENITYNSKDMCYTFRFEGDTTTERITFIGNDSIRWTGRISKFETLRSFNTVFIKPIPSFEQLCNEKVIAGQYRDKKGDLYTFASNGEATWPNKTYMYEVCTSYYGIDKDCIINWSDFDSLKNGYTAYGFKFVGKKLYLYHEKPSDYDYTEFSTKPFLELTKQ
jgi:hypothetical protein